MTKKARPATMLVALLLLANTGWCAQWPRQPFVEIHSEPKSELCIAATEAVQVLRKNGTARLFNTFRDPRTRTASELHIKDLTFPALQIKKLTTLDSRGTERTPEVAYYLVDIDNNGSTDMITLSSGGRGAAGDGDTLYVLEHDVSSAAQPVPNEAFTQVAVEIGGPKLLFYGPKRNFDPAYYIYPFLFNGKSYLLLEGNRTTDLRYLVVELIPTEGIVSRCYF